MRRKSQTSHPGIYMILNAVTDARYVGSAARSLYSRLGEHRYALRNNKHQNKHLQNAWNKYGESAFHFVVLENCTPEQAIDREAHWFNLFKNKGVSLYNLRMDSRSQLGMKHNEGTRRRLSEVNKGKAKHFSPEGKNAIAKAMKGNQYGKRNARPYDLVSPNGEVLRGENLLEFCRQIGLTDVQASALYGVVRGVRKSYKGYTAPQARAAYLAEHPLTRPAKAIKHCEECGKEFAVSRSAAPSRRFCSRECRAAHDKRVYAGAGNPNFRHGGRVAGVKRVRHRK